MLCIPTNHPQRSNPASPYTSSNRVPYSEAAELSAVLQIIAAQHRTTRIGRCSDNQGVVEGQPMVVRQRDCAGVDRDREGQGRPEQIFDHHEGGFDLHPRPMQLAQRHVGESVENLDTVGSAPAISASACALRGSSAAKA